MVFKKIKDFLFGTPESHDKKEEKKEEKKVVKPQNQLKPYQMHEDNIDLPACSNCGYRIAQEDLQTLSGQKLHKQCIRQMKKDARKKLYG